MGVDLRPVGWVPRHSLLLLLAAALILPAIVAVAVGFATTQAERKRAVERSAMTAARQAIALADAELAANVRSLEVIGSTRAIATSDWHSVQLLAGAIRRGNPSWRALLVRDARTGRTLVEVADGDPAGELLKLPAEVPDDGLVEGVARQGRHCPCVVVHSRVPANPALILTVDLAPRLFQDILLRSIEPGTVAALVDRDGHFVARSVDYDNRVGTPATIHVRRAVSKGGHGLYRGRTYEGLDNYTAYATSPSTGWSAHVAVDRTWIDGPRARFITGIAIALAAGLMLAVFLLAYAAREARLRKRDERKFMQLQRADAVARFTSIVVHDFRNLLAASSAGLDLIDRQTQEEKTRENVEAIRKVVRRGERLVERLLSVARGSATEVNSVDLEALLRNAEDLLRRILGGSITFEWSVDPDGRYVVANADQLELSLINLARNARDAMEGKGKFVVESRGEGDMVKLAVCDTGPGVPPEKRERVFEAFYTTKGGIAGTGLGLAQVAGTVRQAGGRVELDDAPDGGARFLLFLPRGHPE